MECYITNNILLKVVKQSSLPSVSIPPLHVPGTTMQVLPHQLPPSLEPWTEEGNHQVQQGGEQWRGDKTPCLIRPEY